MKRGGVMAALVLGILLMPTFASAAHLSITQPAGIVCEGKTYMVDIRLDSPTEYINTIQLELGWDPSRMQIVDTNFSGSLFYFWPFASVDNTIGYAKSIGGIMTPGYEGIGGLVYRPVIKLLGTGPVLLSILPTTDVLLNDGYGTSTSVTFQNMNVSVVPMSDPACATPTPTPAPTAGPPGTPGPTPTPFVCPESPSCSLPEEGVVFPCDFVASCPGEPQRTIAGFVTDADIQCPMQIACPGIGELIPTVTPTEPGTTQQGAYNVLVQVVRPQTARGIIDALYRARPVIGIIAALAALGGVIAVLAALGQLAGIIGSIAGLGSLFWYWLLGLLGLRRKRTRFWGIVYDSATKRPLPLATVELLGADGRVLEKRVTDSEGRFGFRATPESLRASEHRIQLRVSKRGYRFPSVVPVGPESEFYKNIYLGGVMPVPQEKLFSFDIPLDPEVPPVTQPQKPAKTAAFGWLASCTDASYRVSLLAAPVNYFLLPNRFNGILLCIVAVTAFVRSFGVRLRRYGVVSDSTNNMAFGSAFVTLTDHDGQRTGKAVSDRRGRYFLSSQGGMRELAVSSPPRRTSQVIEAPDGWVSTHITV